MHCIRALFSAILLASSLSWFALRSIFLWSTNIDDLFGPSVDFEQLKKDWCRIRRQKVEWKEMLSPCLKILYNETLANTMRFATDTKKSKVTKMKIMPAGEHSKIQIQTYFRNGEPKNFGGDAIRVTLRGETTTAANVWDLGNGQYEAVVLLMSPGDYIVDVRLDYTMCAGLKDPPMEWFVNAHCSGKWKGIKRVIPRNLLSNMTEYINGRIAPSLSITVPPARYNISELPSLIFGLDCGLPCNLFWDGHGEWSSDGKQWRPYIPMDLDVKNMMLSDKPWSRGHEPRKGNLWIYGDSISYYFYQTVEHKVLCKKIFRKCMVTYNWLYPKTLYDLTHTCADVDLNVTLVKNYLENVTGRDDMDDSSVLLFNAGAHYVKNTSFKKYRETIDALIEAIKETYNGTAIWRSSTAIHKQSIPIMGSFRRYITSQFQRSNHQIMVRWMNKRQVSPAHSPLTLDHYRLILKREITSHIPRFITTNIGHFDLNVEIDPLQYEDEFREEKIGSSLAKFWRNVPFSRTCFMIPKSEGRIPLCKRRGPFKETVLIN